MTCSGGVSLATMERYDHAGPSQRAVLSTAPPAEYLHALLDRAVARFPDRSAVSDARRQWTYTDLQIRSRAAAAWLAHRGIGPGDRVLVEAASDVRVAAVFYACSRVGAVFVPLSPGVPDFRRQQIIRDAEPAAVVGSGAKEATLLTVCDLAADVVDSPAEFAAEGPAEQLTAALLYTSGSTADPKGIICPHAAMTFAARAIQARLGYRADDVIHCRLPLSFDYGLYQLLLAALAGAHVVLDGGDAGPDLLAAIRISGATVVPVVPVLATMLIRLAHRDPRPCAVRLFTNTGEELPPPVADELRSRFAGAAVQMMFGISECKRVTINEPDGDLARPGSVGLPLEGTTVKIMDNGGQEVDAGLPGEIVVGGPHVMGGYWRAEELSRSVFRPDAATGRVWLHTGDHGHLDPDGHLYFHGRRDQIFKRHGVRTSVAEIEAAALSVEGVTEACLVPPDGSGDMILFVVTATSTAEVMRSLRERLEAARMPSSCRRMDALPRGTNGKLDRSSLAALVGRSHRD